MNLIEERFERVVKTWFEAIRARPRLLTAIGIAALALPVSMPLLTTALAAGHDTFVYVPRLVEFHESIREGVLLPRWAPDLSGGYGQPLFLFTPPCSTT